jgi:hypothetical protein
MKPINIAVVSMIAAGALLHTYTAVVKSHSFDLGFWLLALLPYVVGSVLHFYFRQSHAAVGALVIPIVMDIGTFYSVFISPQSSTAALALFFVPLWNVFIFVPLGGGVGWWVGKRIRETALSNKTIEPTR